jgi:hypothetical protein
MYIIDMTWNVRRVLPSGAVIVVLLASYVDAEMTPSVAPRVWAKTPPGPGDRDGGGGRPGGLGGLKQWLRGGKGRVRVGDGSLDLGTGAVGAGADDDVPDEPEDDYQRASRESDMEAARRAGKGKGAAAAGATAAGATAAGAAAAAAVAAAAVAAAAAGAAPTVAGGGKGATKGSGKGAAKGSAKGGGADPTGGGGKPGAAAGAAAGATGGRGGKGDAAAVAGGVPLVGAIVPIAEGDEDDDEDSGDEGKPRPAKAGGGGPAGGDDTSGGAAKAGGGGAPVALSGPLLKLAPTLSKLLWASGSKDEKAVTDAEAAADGPAAGTIGVGMGHGPGGAAAAGSFPKPSAAVGGGGSGAAPNSASTTRGGAGVGAGAVPPTPAAGRTSGWIRGAMNVQLADDGGTVQYHAPLPVAHGPSAAGLLALGGVGSGRRRRRAGAAELVHGLPPNPALGRAYPAPYVRLLKNPQCLHVDRMGTVFVGVGLSAAVGTAWHGTSSLAQRGLVYTGLKIRNPESTGGVATVTTLTSGSGHACRLTSVARDALDTVFWARGGNNVVTTDPWVRWHQVGPLVMLRFLLTRGRAECEVVARTRVMTKDRTASRAAQWVILLPKEHQALFERVMSYYS